MRRAYTLIAWLLANMVVGLAWGYTRQFQPECYLPTVIPLGNLSQFSCWLGHPGLALGIPMAALQFAVVGPGLRASWLWIPVTVLSGELLFPAGLGLALGFLFLVSLVSHEAFGFAGLFAPAVAGLVMGSVLGAAQAITLPRRLPDRWMWIMASNLGAVLSLPFWIFPVPGPVFAGLLYALPTSYFVYRWSEWSNRPPS